MAVGVWLQRLVQIGPVVIALIATLGALFWGRQVVEAKNGELAAKDGELKAKNAELAVKDGELKAKDGELKAKDGELKAKNAELAVKDGELKAKNAELAVKDGELKAKNAELAVMERLTAPRLLEHVQAFQALIEKNVIITEQQAEIQVIAETRTHKIVPLDKETAQPAEEL